MRKLSFGLEIRCLHAVLFLFCPMHFHIYVVNDGNAENMHVNNNSNEVRTKHEIKISNHQKKKEIWKRGEKQNKIFLLVFVLWPRLSHSD